MKLTGKIIMLILPIFLFAENFNSYYTMIEKGKYDYVRENLASLKMKHPNEPDVLFLSGLVANNGQDALNIFTDFINKYPDHDKADNAYIKIIEYNYTRGLYNKSIADCETFIEKYQSSERIENCINVLINSYHAVNKKDSAAFYYNKYKRLIPHLNLSYSNSQYKPNLVIVEKDKQEGNFVSYKNQSPIQTHHEERMKYSLQFGAFTSPTNATYLKNKLETKGYNAFTKKIEGKNGKLVAVRVGYFESRSIAESVGRQIKKRENLDYMITTNN